ncbi:hypothetical protein ACIBQX_11165 [Nonomuraea sp. NPDC049714]|uniref:hypothetical protein n=1 Tax=Nonomuraea sp. NPDC049714 TaxID=3364357 RepID=UPI003794BA63
MDEHCISVPFTVRPIAPCGEQNEPGWTSDLIAGRGAFVVRFGFGVGLATTLRGVFFTRVGVGVGTGIGVIVLVGVGVADIVLVGVGDGTAVAVSDGTRSADRVADEQPAASATARTAATRGERIIGPFVLGS